MPTVAKGSVVSGRRGCVSKTDTKGIITTRKKHSWRFGYSREELIAQAKPRAPSRYAASA